MKTMPIGASIALIEGLHARWTFLLERLTDQELERGFIHPEH